MADDLNLENH